MAQCATFRIITNSKHLSYIHPDAFRNIVRLRFLWVLCFSLCLSKLIVSPKWVTGDSPTSDSPHHQKTLFFNELGSSRVTPSSPKWKKKIYFFYFFPHKMTWRPSRASCFHLLQTKEMFFYVFLKQSQSNSLWRTLLCWNPLQTSLTVTVCPNLWKVGHTNTAICGEKNITF